MKSLSPTVNLSYDEARALTSEIRDAVDNVWDLLKQAHAGNAWSALSYPTWEEYVKQEFQMGRSQSYRMLDYANIREALSPNGDTMPTEFQARPLVQLEKPAQQRKAWKAAVKNAGGAPTAKDVQAVVDEIKPPPKPKQSTPRLPAVEDHEYTECLKRLGKLLGAKVREAIELGAYQQLDNKQVILWSKQSDEMIHKINHFVGGGERWKVAHAIQFLAEMPTSEHKIQRLVWLAVAEDGWRGTIDGVQFTLTVTKGRRK